MGNRKSQLLDGRFTVPVNTEIKNAASGVTHSKGFALTVALRVFLSALARQDKRAISLLDEAKKK